MSSIRNEIAVDLAADQIADLQPLPRFVGLILMQALRDGADRIELSLINASSKTGLQIKCSGKSGSFDMTPAASLLFDPAVVVLCNYASIPYYATGHVEGKLHTKRPESHWLLVSDNLKQHVVLSKT